MAIRWLGKDMDPVYFTNYFLELRETYRTLKQSVVGFDEIETTNSRRITECIELGERVSSLNDEAPSCKRLIVEKSAACALKMNVQRPWLRAPLIALAATSVIVHY
ncbi:hypothetical protein FGADI_1476 [Fusarium gaditjirri]|uniref:Uncharacterized protein n=1 Tax=Fusarium gaditjirri TaxID=282569 RepID=A0A8H4X2N2_9HYPO|nr:hypothetical protein FGADI_1476 [Fusarium gaditjirri]